MITAVLAIWVFAWAIAPRLLWARAGFRGFVARGIWITLGVLIAAPGVWSQAAALWPGDSFFTLRPADRWIVGAIATAIAVLYLMLADRIGRAFGDAPSPLRVFAAASGATGATGAFLAGFVLSPQAFYLYYTMIFDGLPAQWVVNPSLSVERFVAFLPLPADAALADHAAGLVFWIGLGLAASRAVDRSGGLLESDARR